MFLDSCKKKKKQIQNNKLIFKYTCYENIQKRIRFERLYFG